jgi:hypothetical protein
MARSVSVVFLAFLLFGLPQIFLFFQTDGFSDLDEFGSATD